MAKVLNPLNSSEARGRVGGLVYNTWRGHRTVKTHTNPTNQGIGLRGAQFAIIVAAGKRWKGISASQRAAWETYAVLHPDPDWTGQPKRIAGYHWFVRCNVNTYRAFLSWTDDPPPNPCLLDLVTLTPEMDYSDVKLTWTLATALSDPPYILQIWRTKPLSAGINPTLHDAYFLGHQNALLYEYYDLGPQPGSYTYWARIIHYTGAVSTYLRCSIVVTA